MLNEVLDFGKLRYGTGQLVFGSDFIRKSRYPVIVIDEKRKKTFVFQNIYLIPNGQKW